MVSSDEDSMESKGPVDEKAVEELEDVFFHTMYDKFVANVKENRQRIYHAMDEYNKDGKNERLASIVEELIAVAHSQQNYMGIIWVVLSMIWHRKDDRKQNIELLNQLMADIMEWKDQKYGPIIEKMKEFIDEMEKLR